MKRASSFFCFLLFCSGMLLPSAHAQIVVGNGQTVTLANVVVVADIIVEEGGTLVIADTVFMSWAHIPQLTILIEDGGRMISNGGELIGFSPDRFKGIIVEGTEFGGNAAPALDLNNFSLSNAELGLELSANKQGGGSDTINQAVFVSNSTFSNCTNMVRNYGDLGYAGFFNRDNSYNPVVFESCQFVSEGSFWTIHVSFSNQYSFESCVFDIANDWNLHFNHTRNTVVRGCQFINPDAAHGAIFHRDNFNPTVVGNNFFGPGNGTGYGAICCGGVHVNGTFHGGTVTGNAINNATVGFSIGDADNHLDGTPGIANATLVSGNSFNLCRVGMQSEESSNMRVHGNSFTHCRVGLKFNGEANSSPRVYCNGVFSCLRGFLITDTQLAEFAGTTFVDPNNRFFGGGTHISANNGIFQYSLWFNPYPGKAVTTSGVAINIVNTLGFCQQWFQEPPKEEESDR